MNSAHGRRAALLSILLVTLFVGASACTSSSGGNGAGGGDAMHDLEASLVRGYLDLPVGVAMGGYGGRTGGEITDNRLQEWLANSTGFYQRITIRVLVLDNGPRRIVFVRLPIIFPTDLLRSTVIDKVMELTEEDTTYELFISATHTHSGPARYVEIPDIFGSAGVDSFQQEIFIRMTDQIAGAVSEALLAERTPVKFGYGANDDFDMEDYVNRDRREADNGLYVYGDYEGNPYDSGREIKKDPRMHIIRLDNLDGTPFAAMVSLAVHGTAFGADNSLFSEDVPGLIEVKTEEAFLADPELGEVTAIFFQGSAGNVGPGNAPAGHGEARQLEAVGLAAAERAVDLYKNIEAEQTSVELEMFVNRAPVSRELIGYGADEFLDNQGDPIRHGAFLCGESYEDDDDPTTFMSVEEYDCPLIIETVADVTLKERFDMFDKVVFSAARIGDLLITAVPGELTTPLNFELQHKLYQSYGIDRSRSVSYAYAQDHQFYLLLPDDWVQGGYETTVNIWGPKFGQYLTGMISALAEPALSEELEDPADYNELPEWEHIEWLEYRISDDEFPLYATPNAGNVIDQPAPGGAERFDVVSFSWLGGDPFTDMPTVRLQMANGAGGWSDIPRADGGIIDSSGYEMFVSLDMTDDKPVWSAHYEFLKDAEPGEYRFAFWGNYSDGSSTGAYGSEADPLFSDSFTLAEDTDLTVSEVAISGTTVSLRVGYPISQGGYRLRNYDYNAQVSDPIASGSATVQIYNGTTVVDSAAITINSADGTGSGTLSAAPSGTFNVRATAQDDLGNSTGGELQVTADVTP